MSELVRIVRGMWVKAMDGEWFFDLEPGEISYLINLPEYPPYESVTSITRRKYSLAPDTKMVLTFLHPEWMMTPADKHILPCEINNTLTMGFFMTTRQRFVDVAIGVTVGVDVVESYQFQRRTAYTVTGDSGWATLDTVDTQQYRYTVLGPGEYWMTLGRLLIDILSEDEMLKFAHLHQQTTSFEHHRGGLSVSGPSELAPPTAALQPSHYNTWFHYAPILGQLVFPSGKLFPTIVSSQVSCSKGCNWVSPN